jgi:6-phosphogluconolactonase
MPTDASPRLIRSTDFARDAAQFILNEGQAALAARGLFRLGLSGGNTPRQVHAALVDLAGSFPWTKVQITFGDERCVPPDHEQSNYRMAKESLLDAVSVPAGNVFRIRGEIAPDAAADEYDRKLSAFASRAGEPRYVHDLLLLGLGEDGHTASLFPGSPALEETDRNVVAVIGPKPPPQRVTMTFPLINSARQICFLVNDAAKQSRIDAILSGTSTDPAARVRPVAGQITWITGV